MAVAGRHVCFLHIQFSIPTLCILPESSKYTMLIFLTTGFAFSPCKCIFYIFHVSDEGPSQDSFGLTDVHNFLPCK